MSLKIVFSSDWHIGLKTDDVDRTSEILEIGKQVVSHCSKLKKDGHEVILIIGGDIFNTNTPSEQNIADFISWLVLVKKLDVKTYIMAGNHDTIADPKRLSCLGFIRRAKIAFPKVTVVEDIKFMEVATTDNGPLYFTFLPHITKALVHRKINDGKLKKEVSPQEYIDQRCERILTKVGRGSQHYVFSHLNVKGAHPGSEANLLKKSEVYLPSVFTNTQMGYCEPTIIQAHIHSNSIMGNIHIIGSPICCGFGESFEKYFCEINISNHMGEEDEINLIRTNCKQFMQLEVDMMNETREFFKIPEVKKFLDSIIPEMNPVVKFDISINPENNTYDWTAIRKKIETNNVHMKPITPRVIFKRPVRSVDQKISLPPKKAVQTFLKKNLKKDVKRMKRIYAISTKYLE